MFLAIPAPGREAQIFKAGAAYYIVLGLCVSDSILTIKTGSLLWFVVGVLSTRPYAQLKSTKRPADRASALQTAPFGAGLRSPTALRTH
jgi:hypothetical protein